MYSKKLIKIVLISSIFFLLPSSTSMVYAHEDDIPPPIVFSEEEGIQIKWNSEERVSKPFHILNNTTNTLTVELSISPFTDETGDSLKDVTLLTTNDLVEIESSGTATLALVTTNPKEIDLEP
ncbi:MAG: hypothetical protein JEZ06_09505, partial [Anaerolineaceae bacterium]|nr:hypothetical protein [Anaerolineaceae bacterium]